MGQKHSLKIQTTIHSHTHIYNKAQQHQFHNDFNAFSMSPLALSLWNTITAQCLLYTDLLCFGQTVKCISLIAL